VPESEKRAESLRVSEAWSLTERERSVVSDITFGTPLKVIASSLAISVQAVSTYLLRAQRKVGAKSRSDLLAICAGNTPSLNRTRIRSTSKLTPAEVAVANAIVAGESYSSIAKARATSTRTIQHQVHEILRKYGVRSRFELAALACQRVRPLTTQRS
jgi:DNA-binding NarL/FixJ family response regulator